MCRARLERTLPVPHACEGFGLQTQHGSGPSLAGRWFLGNLDVRPFIAMQTMEESTGEVKKKLKEYDPKSTNCSKHYLVAIFHEQAELREFLEWGQQSGNELLEVMCCLDQFKE